MSDEAPPFPETILREETVLPDEAVTPTALGGAEAALKQKSLKTPLVNASHPGEVYDAKWINAPNTIRADKGRATPQHVNEFANLLCTHNLRLPEIKMLKDAFNQKMQTSAAFRDAIAALYHDARNPTATTSGAGDANALMDQIGLTQAAPFHRLNGDRDAYDPWDGWWKGDFSSGGKTYQNYHVWDPTVRVRSNTKHCSSNGIVEDEAPAEGGAHSYEQYVQMVTQIAKLNSVSAAAANDTKFWYAGANFMRNGLHPLGKTDFAINVWSPQDGLTGYVLKRQTGVEHLFLFAYLLDDETLLWVAFVEGGGLVTKTNGVQMTLFIYAEHGQATGGSSRIYTIRGADGTVTYREPSGQPAHFELSDLNNVSGHRGDYKIQPKKHHPNSPLRPKATP
ncbi:MAG: hypothetical protein ACPGGK_00620 [Pikeienuella sp.]